VPQANAYFIVPDFGFVWIRMPFPVRMWTSSITGQHAFLGILGMATVRRSDAANEIRLVRIVRPLSQANAHNSKNKRSRAGGVKRGVLIFLGKGS